VRVLPTILDFIKVEKKLPLNLVFGFAAMIRFYKGSWKERALPVKDSPQIVEEMTKNWQLNDLNFTVSQTLANTEFWDQDLNEIEGLAEALTFAIAQIEENGVEIGYQNFIAQFS
jgi:tagaturonate reductase